MDEQAKSGTKQSFNSVIFFIKLDRLAAWVLLLVILAYAITGYGLTKGLIDQQLALSLHLGWLGAIGLVAFVIHTHHAIGLAFKRWRIWNKISRFCLFFFYVLMIVFFFICNFFIPVLLINILLIVAWLIVVIIIKSQSVKSRAQVKILERYRFILPVL